MMSAPKNGPLKQLADAAGLQIAWRDAHGTNQLVSQDTQLALLNALGLPCNSEAQCRDSLQHLKEEDGRAGRPSFILVQAGESVMVRRQGSLHYRLELDDGKRIMGTARDIGRGCVAIDAIRTPGYHTLQLGDLQCTVAVVPSRLPSVAERLKEWAGRHGGHASGRAWVLGAQLFSLHRGALGGESRPGNAASRQGGAGERASRTGVMSGWEAGGDFGLLKILAENAAAAGAAGVAISPVHAMFSADPQRYSPYAPSSRLFLNVMYADPSTVFGTDVLEALDSASDTWVWARGACADWPAIQVRRLSQLRKLYAHFTLSTGHPRKQDFQKFVEKGGEALFRHASYEALHAKFSIELGPGHGWREWPAEFHNPAGEAVRRFAADNPNDVRFHLFLQWLAACSLGAAQQAAAHAMPFGLIADLAVGTDPRGSQAWSHQDQIMGQVSVGAPPDLFQPAGQDWGLTAFSPRALQQHGYRGFIDTVRAVLAYAGGIRVDHFMGLERMWLVPKGAQPSDGAYLMFPRDALMDVLKLEAWRHHALVVGENLGTVSEDFNDAVHRRGFMGMSVLWFEQQGQEAPAFKLPAEWSEQTMAMISTHDLPTLKGWWLGRDIDWRERQGQYGAEQVAHYRQQRDQEKQALWAALQRAGLTPEDQAAPNQAPVMQIFEYLAATPAVLLSIGLEDLVGEEEQPNLPGEAAPGQPDRHPNWLRMLPVAVDAIFKQPDVLAILNVVRPNREVS